MLGRNVRSSVRFETNNDLDVPRCVLENELKLSCEADDQTHPLAVSWTVERCGRAGGEGEGICKGRLQSD